MTLPQPQPPHSSLHYIKPHLSPPQQLTPSSSLSPSPTPSISSTSFRSTSDTYVNDLGGPCIPDRNWPPSISRSDVHRVYDSTDDERDVLQPALRKHVLDILETVDVGVYDEWAVQADDALSIEELQEHAEHISRAIDAGKTTPTKRRPRFRNDIQRDVSHELDDVPIPVMDMLETENLEKPEKRSGWTHLRGARHRRIETLPDDDLSDIMISDDVQVRENAVAERKRGHRRIETLDDDTSIPMSNGHNRVETLDDVDECEPPALKRVETLPDEPLDTPVLNGVQRMGFDDVMNIPLPSPLPSPVGTDDTPRGMLNSDVETTDGSGMGKIDSLSEDDTVEMSLDRRRENQDATKSGRVGCVQLSELSRRIGEVTRCLADVQMITASHAASAEATLPRTNNTYTRDEISHLRITLDHLARLILEHAYQTSDAIDKHSR